MSFESFLEKITTLSRPDSVLVCEAGFNALRAVIVEKKGSKLTMGQEMTSDLFDKDEAVEDVVKKAKQLGWKGQHAILVNPAVCFSVLDLSIPINNKLPVRQLEESMQWELEPAYNQHKTVLTIGQLLQLRNHLTTEQVEEVLQSQNELINSKNSAVVYKRFGELALEMGFINQKQLNDTLSRQQWFTSEGDTLKCGWRGQAFQPMADTGDYKWTVAGLKLDLLRSWQVAFSKQQIKLEALYPIAAGASVQGARSVENREAGPKSDKNILLEVHEGLMLGIVQMHNEPFLVQSVPCSSTTVLGQINGLISALAQEDDVPVKLIDSLNDNAQQSQQLLTDISTITGREISMQQVPGGKISLAMRNAVRHYLRTSDYGHIVDVSVHEPLPPVMQRFSVRAVLAALLIIGLIGISEIGLLGAKFWYKANISSISKDVGRIRAEKKRINKKIDQVKKLKSEIESKEAEKRNATTMISLLTKELPKRNQTLTSLMDKLQESVTDDIVVNNILEDTILGFNLNAWALSDQAAQSFVKRFQLAIHPMGYRIKNLTVSEQTGRLGLIGYAVKFSITPYSEKEWKERKKAANKRPY